MLKIADPDKEFIVCTDACKRELGGVLMQEGHVICYESRKLNEHEQNYVTCDLELESIIHDSYHSGLRYSFDQPNLNVRQARWLATLGEFDFEIRNIKGK